MTKLTAILKNKKLQYIFVLVILLLSAFTYYFVFVRINPNDRILTTNGTALFANENPTFTVNFGDKNEPSNQYIKFEAEASSKNPFNSEKRQNIFTKIIELFAPKKKYGIEMSLKQINFSETSKTGSDNYDTEVKKVADILGTSDIKTSTTVVDSGRDTTVSVNDQKNSKPTVINANVVNGIDFEYQIIKGKGLKEDIIIQSLDGFSEECKHDLTKCKLPLNEYTFDLKMDAGVSVKEGWYSVDGKTTKIYYFVDKEGNYLAHFLPSYAEDSNGSKTSNVTLEIKNNGDGDYKIKVTVDSSWLLDSNRIYPVRIDPSIVHDTSSDFSTGTFMSAKYLIGSELQMTDSSTIGDWSFDETTTGTCTGGGDICDRSGNNNNATIAGTVTSVAGIDNYARDFNGATGTHASLGDLSAFEVQTFTIEGWIRKEGTCGAFNYCTIFSKGGSGFKGYTFGLTGSSPVLDIRLDDQGADGLQVIHGTTVLSNNTWYYVAVVVDGVNKSMKLYLNGNLEASGQYSDTLSYGTEVVKIGNGNTNDDLPFNGSIDDIKFSTRAKSQVEIQSAYNRYSFGVYRSPIIGIQGVQNITFSYLTSGVKTADGETPYSTTGLVAQWNFNETSGTTAVSGGSCGTSCNGTLTNMTTTGQDAATSSGWTANNRRWGSGALMFDGSNDYINAGTNSALNITGDLTIETWVRIDTLPTSWKSIVSKANSDSDNSYVLRFGGSSIIGQFYDGNGSSVNNILTWNPSTCVKLGQWTHIVAVRSVSGNYMQVYCNGVLNNSSSGSITTAVTSSASVDIGANTSSSPTQFFPGIIDSTRIYSRALTATEILSNYNSGTVEFQMRGGNTTNADDGTWSSWNTVTNESTINSLDNTNLYSTYTPGLTAYWTMDDSSSVANKATTLATGGTVTYSNGYVIHTFTSSGTLIVNGSGTVDVLVVGGGGGGGGSAGAGGGGGAGAVVYRTSVNVTGQSYTVTVGSGGAGSSATGGTGTNGANSSFGSVISATGGGGGGGYDGSNTTAAGNGASGGGGGSSASGTFSGGSGITDLGNNGGAGVSTSTTGSQSGGGGGGASTAGQAGTATKSGNGGDGLSVSITGTAVTYGGGGAGAKRTTGSAGTPGAGGGGTAGVGTAGGAGTDGLGGGGGGGGASNAGGKGGNGIVIVRYLATQQGSVNTSYNGTITGTTLVSGTSSNARNFNGSSDFIAISSMGTYSKDSSITLAAWVQSNVTDTGTHEILSLTGSANSFVVKIVENNYLFRAQTGKATVGGDNADDTTTVVNGNWYYVVGVFSSSQVKLYVNGQLKATTNYSNATTSVANSNGWNIGKYIETGTSYYYWKGVVDEARVFNSALSASDIQADYLQGLQTFSFMQKTASPIFMDSDSSTRLKNSLNTGLTAYWNLNETSGSSLSDSVGGNTLTATGTTITSGKYNLGRSFNGTSDYASRASITTYNTSRTVEFWFKPAATGSQRGILSVGNSVADAGPMWLIAQTSGNLLSVYHGGSYRNGTTTLAAGTWYHGVYTFDSSTNAVVLYLNGKAEYSGTAADSNLANTNLYVGTGYGGYFSGALDEVKIYNIAKTADEILEEYNATSTYYTNYNLTSTNLSSKTSVPFYVASDKPGSYISAILGETSYANYQTDANTLGLWHLDELSGSGSYIKDNSGFGRNCSIVNVTSSYGKIGPAANLAAGYLSCGTATVPTLTNFSVSSWVYISSLPSATATIFGKRGSTASGDCGYGFTLSVTTTGAIALMTDPTTACGDGTTLTSTGTISTGMWHYIVGTFASGTGKIYIDGKLDTSGTGLATPIGSGDYTAIGGYYSAYAGGWIGKFTGLLDEVRMDSVVRSADDVRQAYEVAARTLDITIQFGANLSNSNLITNSSDLLFTVDATKQGFPTMGSNLYTGDKIIVKETVSGTEYIAQGTVSAVNTLTGAVTVQSWDSSSTFPGSGFSSNAYVFKWERQYMPLSGRTLPTQIDAINLLTLRVTDAYGGRNIWIDDLKSNGGYINTSGGSIDLGQAYQYAQYRAILTSADGNVSPYINQVQVDYISPGPTMDQVMRHGMWFDGGVKRSFWWVKSN